MRPVTGRPWERSPLAWAPRAPRAGALAEALKVALPPAGAPRPACPPAAMAVRPGLWPALLGIVLAAWPRGSGESHARSGEVCGGQCARTLAALELGRGGSLTRIAGPSWEPPRGQTLRGGTRGPPLIVAQLPRALPRKPGFCQVQEQLLARGAGECRRPTPQGEGSLLVAGPRAGSEGWITAPGEPGFEGFDHLPVPRKSRRAVKIPLPGSICLKQLLTVPSLGTWPLPTSRTLCPPLSPPHRLAHVHTQAWRRTHQPPALAACTEHCGSPTGAGAPGPPGLWGPQLCMVGSLPLPHLPFTTQPFLLPLCPIGHPNLLGNSALNPPPLGRRVPCILCLLSLSFHSGRAVESSWSLPLTRALSRAELIYEYRERGSYL